MRFCWLFVCLLAIGNASRAQIQPAAAPTLHFHEPGSASVYLNNLHVSPFAGMRSDPMMSYRYPSPWMTTWPGTASQNYWLSSTTTQSFNRGKWGTIYYYDMLGNMRYARTFIDIAGKNKRGLKLLLPTINQRMLMQR